MKVPKQAYTIEFKELVVKRIAMARRRFPSTASSIAPDPNFSDFGALPATLAAGQDSCPGSFGGDVNAECQVMIFLESPELEISMSYIYAVIPVSATLMLLYLIRDTIRFVQGKEVKHEDLDDVPVVHHGSAKPAEVMR